MVSHICDICKREVTNKEFYPDYKVPIGQLVSSKKQKRKTKERGNNVS